MARSYNRLRETTFDLYVERDALPSYYRFSSLCASWLAIIGYILFALSSSVSREDLKPSRYTLAVVAGILLLLGYLGVAVVAFISRSLLFTVDAALYPLLTASSAGLLITTLTYALHIDHSVQRIYVVIPCIVSITTTVFSAIFLFLVHREISKIKSRDERRRWHLQLLPYSDARAFQSHTRIMSGPEDEAQRRQLARLLDDRRETSSMENLRGTYKIDLPGEPPVHRGRSSSVPARRNFQLNRLLPWNNQHVGTFKDARERRREEIERSSIPPHSAFGYAGTSPDSSMWYQRSRSPSREPLPEQQDPQNAWGWPPATRYA